MAKAINIITQLINQSFYKFITQIFWLFVENFYSKYRAKLLNSSTEIIKTDWNWEKSILFWENSGKL